MESVSFDIGGTVHNVGRFEKSTKRVGAGVGGASRRIVVGNERRILLGSSRGEMRMFSNPLAVDLAPERKPTDLVPLCRIFPETKPRPTAATKAHSNQ